MSGKYKVRDDIDAIRFFVMGRDTRQGGPKRPYTCENCGAELRCPDPDRYFEETGKTLKCSRCGWHLGNEP